MNDRKVFKMNINNEKLVYTSEKEKELKETLIYLIKIQHFDTSKGNCYNYGIENSINECLDKLNELRRG